jgi:hypothetical protein
VRVVFVLDSQAGKQVQLRVVEGEWKEKKDEQGNNGINRLEWFAG